MALQDFINELDQLAAAGQAVEDEWHNFEALNIPKSRPARDPLENFYLATAAVSLPGGKGPLTPTLSPEEREKSGALAPGEREMGPMLLRSQTSTVQIRV